MAGSVIDAPYSALLVTASATSAAAGAKFLLGFVNYDKVAQTATLAVSDNNAATLGIPQQAALGASAVVLYPAPGIPVNGLSVVPSAAVTGAGIGVLYRTNVG